MYCKKCGGKIESYASHCPFCGEPLANNNVQATYSANQAPVSGEHKGIGGWILTYIITCIPLVGFIMLLVWACGDKTKSDPTFRNWARAQLVIAIISAILGVILMIAMVALIGSLSDMLDDTTLPTV